MRKQLTFSNSILALVSMVTGWLAHLEFTALNTLSSTTYHMSNNTKITIFKFPIQAYIEEKITRVFLA